MKKNILAKLSPFHFLMLLIAGIINAIGVTPVSYTHLGHGSAASAASSAAFTSAGSRVLASMQRADVYKRQE